MRIGDTQFHYHPYYFQTIIIALPSHSRSKIHIWEPTQQDPLHDFLDPADTTLLYRIINLIFFFFLIFVLISPGFCIGRILRQFSKFRFYNEIQKLVELSSCADLLLADASWMDEGLGSLSICIQFQ